MYFTVQYYIEYSSTVSLFQAQNVCKSGGDVAGTAKKRQELEAQRKDKERQEEEEVTEELKKFMTQEVARGFSLFEEALLVFEAQDRVEWYTKEGCSSCSECNPVLPCHL